MPSTTDPPSDREFQATSDPHPPRGPRSQAAAGPSSASGDGLRPLAAELAAIAEELGLRRVAQRLVADTERRLVARRLRVLVLGEIKHGKSSLANAVLGHASLPVGVTPTTTTIITVRPGETTAHRLRRDDGGIDELSPEAFDRAVRGKTTPTGHLELFVPSDLLDAGIELVDTPGLNDLTQLHALLTKAELPSADVLVLVLDATQLLRRSELVFLRDALRVLGGAGPAATPILIALNRIDLVEDAERPALRDHLRRELRACGDGLVFAMFETDARTAMRDPQATTTGTQGVAELRAKLRELAGTKESLLDERVRSGLSRTTDLLRHSAEVQARALTMTDDVIRRERAEIERALVQRQLELEPLRAQLKADESRLIAEFRTRTEAFARELEQNALASLDYASLRALSTHLPGALHDAFVGHLRAESDRLRLALEELTRTVLHTGILSGERRLHEAAHRLSFLAPAAFVAPPPVGLEATMVLVGVIGTAVLYLGNIATGLAMTVAGPLSTVVLHEKSIRDARTRARAEVPRAVAETVRAVDACVTVAIEEHIAALEDYVVLASDSLGEQLVALLDRSRDALRTGDVAEKRAAIDRLFALSNRLAALSVALQPSAATATTATTAQAATTA